MSGSLIEVRADPLSVSEKVAAQMLGISPRTLFDMEKRGEVRAFKCGGRKLYSVQDLQAWIFKRLDAAGGGDGGA